MLKEQFFFFNFIKSDANALKTIWFNVDKLG